MKHWRLVAAGGAVALVIAFQVYQTVQMAALTEQLEDQREDLRHAASIAEVRAVMVRVEALETRNARRVAMRGDGGASEAGAALAEDVGELGDDDPYIDEDLDDPFVDADEVESPEQLYDMVRQAQREASAEKSEARDKVRKNELKKKVKRFAKRAELPEEMRTALKDALMNARQQKKDIYAAVQSGETSANDAASALHALKRDRNEALKGMLDGDQYAGLMKMLKRNKKGGGGKKKGRRGGGGGGGGGGGKKRRR